MYYPPMRGNPGRVLPPPPPQQGTGFGQGVKQFIDSYRSEQAAKKENARQLFEQHAKMLEAGLPVDKKKMAKWAREADLHFDLDAPPPPPAQAPMTPNPQMQGAAQYGMQQSMGGPQVAPPPPPPQAAAPGGLRGLIQKIGQATGVPQPPSQAEQMGVMRMLNEMQARGGQNKQMEAMRQQMAMKGMQAMRTIEEGLSRNLTMEDPRMAQALRTMMLLRGMQGGDMGAVGKVAENEIARQMFPGVFQKADAKAAADEEAKQNEKIAGIVAGKMPNATGAQIKAAMGGDFSALDEAIGEKESAKLTEELAEMKEKYQDVPSSLLSEYLTLKAGGASLAELGTVLDKIGKTTSTKLAERRAATSEKQAGTSARSADNAAKSLNLRMQDAETAARVAKVVGDALAETMTKDGKMDPDKARVKIAKTLSGSDLLEADLLLSKRQGSTTVNNLFVGGAKPE